MSWRVVCLFGMVALAACDQVSKQENVFSTYTEASASGAVAYGFLPKFLPLSAQRIQEMHGRQSNDLLVTFAYAPADYEAMVAKCRAVTVGELFYPRVFTEWWPQDLRSASFQSPSYAYFRCVDEGGLLAINQVQSIAYYWRL